MSLRDRIAERQEKSKLREMIEARAAIAEPPEKVVQNIPTPWEAAGTAALGGIREAAQGLSFGTADEIEAGARSLFSDQSYGDLSQGIQSDRDQYSGAHPYAAFTANVAGGLLNPANKLKALNWTPNSILGRVGKVGQSVVEGAAEGFASGREGQRGESAGIGAGFGGILGFGGQLLSQAKNRNPLIGNLDTPEGFVPIPLAAETESGLGSLYRRTVGRAIGGGKLMKQQEDVLKRAGDVVEGLEGKRATVLRRTLDRIDQLKDDAQETYKQQSRAAKIQTADVVDDIHMSKNIQDIETDDVLTAARREADASRARRTSGVADKTEELIGLGEEAARKKIYLQAVPEGVPEEMRYQIAELAKTNPQAANAQIDNLWRGNGFGMVKNADGFDVNPSQVLGDLNVELEPYMAQRLPILFEQLNTKGVKRLTGTQMMDLRNELAIKANRLTNARGEPAIERGVLRSAMDKLDGVIADGLGKDGGKAYLRERNAYGNFQSALDATESAFSTKQGKWDATDYLNAERRFSGRQAAKGATRQGETLQEVQRAQAAIKEQGTTSTRQVGEAVNEAMRVAEDTQKGTKRAVAVQARQGVKDQRRALRQTLDKLGDEKAASDSVLRNARNKAADAPRVAAADAELNQAKGLKKTLQDRSVAKSKGTVEALAATSILGSPIAAGMGFNPAGLFAGIPVAMALSTPSVQRWLVGQSLPNITPEQFKKISQNIPQAVRTAMIQESQDPELALYAEE